MIGSWGCKGPLCKAIIRLLKAVRRLHKDTLEPSIIVVVIIIDLRGGPGGGGVGGPGGGLGGPWGGFSDDTNSGHHFKYVLITS